MSENQFGRQEEMSSDDSSSSSENELDQQRELTEFEMEKLVQLQDLTGIEDLQICRALLGKTHFDVNLQSLKGVIFQLFQRAKIGIWRQQLESI